MFINYVHAFLLFPIRIEIHTKNIE